MTDTLRIYVADLAAYNAGYLHGIWIDADQDIETVWEAVRTMLSASPVEDAEEYAIHEYSGVEEVLALAAFIDEHPEFGVALLAYWNDDPEQASTAIENYAGAYDRKLAMLELEAIREYRNASVHTGAESEDAWVFCFQMQFYFRRMFFFLLSNSNNFSTLADAQSFLDYNQDTESLKKMKRLVELAIKYRK